MNATTSSSTSQTSTRLPGDLADYSVLLPPAIVLALVAALVSIFILLMTYFNKRLQTINHLLICNTCVWSIFCAVVQTNNYIFVLFFDWITSDVSCRIRGYFAYTTIAGVIYSYTAQAMSRLFIVFSSHKFPWLTAFKSHLVLIICQWLISFLVALPAIATEDIFYRIKSLCWVTHLYMVHVSYTCLAYYVIPTLATFIIYFLIYYRVKQSTARTNNQANRRISNRDLELSRNVLIFLSIYLSGGIPTTIYIFFKVGFFYLIGISFVSLGMVVEKVATLFVDRQLRITLKKIICRRTTRRIGPIAVLNPRN